MIFAIVALGLSMFGLGMIAQYAISHLVTQEKKETFTAPF